MKFERERLELWLEERTPRECILIFGVGFALVYILWTLIFGMPLQHQIKNMVKQNQDLALQLSTQKKNIESIDNIISSSSFARNLARQHQLNWQATTLGKQLQDLQSDFIPPEWLARVTNDVIAQQEEVALVSLKSFSAEPWKQTIDKDSFLSAVKDIYQHKMELEFRGTYFNAILFLSHLEKLPWHLYWDKLDYQVQAYPEAKVVVRFYVLSNQKG